MSSLFSPCTTVFPRIQNYCAGNCIGDFLPFDLFEIKGDIREQGVPLNYGVDNGKKDSVCQEYGLLKHLSATADKNLVCPRARGECRIQVMSDNATFDRKISLSGENNILSSGQRTTDALKRLPSHNDIMSPRNFMEPLTIGGKFPGHLVITSNDTVFRHDGYEGDDHMCAEFRRRRSNIAGVLLPRTAQWHT